jgi:glycogen debranching enzyme
MDDERYDILARSGLLDERTLVLMRDDTSVVADRQGNLVARSGGRHGLYHEGTRFLSGCQLSVYGLRPLLLSSGVRDDAALVFVHETNPDVRRDGRPLLPHDTLHVLRQLSLEPGRCRIEIAVRSYAAEPIECELQLALAADFADVFEVRGARRAQRGDLHEPQVGAGRICFGYRGLDARVRETRVELPAPARIEAGRARVRLSLAPGATETFELRVECRVGAAAPARRRVRALDEAKESLPRITSTSRSLDAWLRNARADLHMLTAQTEHGPYPYAGVPWFATPFGRDGLVTALQTLWWDPELSRGVLRFLAANQCDADRPDVDGEPGKILHELRCGEMAACGEIPFGCYYGSVDATPLFVMLAAAHHERTGDDETLRALWPHLERALAWIEGPGDRDGDGFLEYQRRSAQGLLNQGWKDSRDSVMHADGSLAPGPIALCEVQGYAYAARVGLARLARHLGDAALGSRLEADAAALRERFGAAFWCEELGSYALALDGDKRPCRVRASNAGHALWSGIARPDHAAAVARTLLSPGHWSGWGVRTLATGEPRYNPISYHNGSVWPHDNAIAAAGLARYGEREAAQAIFTAMLDASRTFERARLPELFCGFERAPGETPTLYPVACAPQAWSCGAVFQLLEVSLGLRVDAARLQVQLTSPRLPPFVGEVEILGLRVGSGTIDLRVERNGTSAAYPRVLRRSGPVELVIAGEEAGSS